MKSIIRALFKKALESELIRRLFQELLAIVAKDVVSGFKYLRQETYSKYLVENKENRRENDVQLFSESISPSKSNERPSGLRLVVD